MEYLFVGIMFAIALAVLGLIGLAGRRKPKRTKWIDSRDSERLKKMKIRQSLQSVDDPYRVKVQSIRETHQKKRKEKPSGLPHGATGAEWVATKSQEDVSPSRSRASYRSR